jgi:hypothetical protein
VLEQIEDSFMDNQTAKCEEKNYTVDGSPWSEAVDAT